MGRAAAISGQQSRLQWQRDLESVKPEVAHDNSEISHGDTEFPLENRFLPATTLSWPRVKKVKPPQSHYHEGRNLSHLQYNGTVQIIGIYGAISSHGDTEISREFKQKIPMRKQKIPTAKRKFLTGKQKILGTDTFDLALNN